ISFSVPRWSKPIWGSTRSTTSPSSSSTRRSTPWAAGCCCPKLMVKLRSAVSGMSAYQLRRRLRLITDLRIQAIPRDTDTLVTPLADQVHSIMSTDLENNLAPLHVDDFSVDLDR